MLPLLFLQIRRLSSQSLMLFQHSETKTMYGCMIKFVWATILKERKQIAYPKNANERISEKFLCFCDKLLTNCRRIGISEKFARLRKFPGFPSANTACDRPRSAFKVNGLHLLPSFGVYDLMLFFTLFWYNKQSMCPYCNQFRPVLFTSCSRIKYFLKQA